MTQALSSYKATPEPRASTNRQHTRGGKHSRHTRVRSKSQPYQASSRLAQVAASDQIPYQTVHSVATNTASAELHTASYNQYSDRGYSHCPRGSPYSTTHAPHSTAHAPYSAPPKPPQQLNAQLASDPNTHILVLWYIAQHIPYLRKWIIANSAADAQLLEYIAQCGGPGVQEAFEVLFASMEQ